MKPELDAALCRDFPNLYKNRRNPMSAMIYGFQCGDGCGRKTVEIFKP